MIATGKNIMRASPNFHVLRGREPTQEPSAVTHGGHVAQGGAAAANDPDDRGDLKGADC